ncbi:HU family DNA-binding protein [Piscirickettsia salmonis]|uniref:HU family DNA-binding protein n=1 Tax=Piscirickettsia salmonis TaxID=1238 RepID=UPI0007C8C33E|nr:DNA-binding protein HRL53 [Piscirickettsiaceae bacterium NZ-RLO1]
MPRKKAAATKPAAPTASRKAKFSAITERMTKIQVVNSIAEETGLPKKDVLQVFESLRILISRHMKKRGSGEFTIPEVGVKIRRSKKAATKARTIISPFNGEEIHVPAKPARTTVKVTALKALKETVL